MNDDEPTCRRIKFVSTDTHVTSNSTQTTKRTSNIKPYLLINESHTSLPKNKHARWPGTTDWRWRGDEDRHPWVSQTRTHSRRRTGRVHSGRWVRASWCRRKTRIKYFLAFERIFSKNHATIEGPWIQSLNYWSFHGQSTFSYKYIQFYIRRERRKKIILRYTNK